MKPLSICLVHMGKKGFEMVETYPKVLPNEILKEITYKSMPLGGKDGDFLSGGLGDVFYSSYTFRITENINERDNIASIIAVYPSFDYNIAGTQKVFEIILGKLKETSLLKLELLVEILPKIFDGFVNGKFTINIKSLVSVSIDFDERVEPKKTDSDTFADDMW